MNSNTDSDAPASRSRNVSTTTKRLGTQRIKPYPNNPNIKRRGNAPTKTHNLPTTEDDLDFFILNMGHDVYHDYTKDKRTKDFSKLNDEIKGIIATFKETQSGGTYTVTETITQTDDESPYLLSLKVPQKSINKLGIAKLEAKKKPEETRSLIRYTRLLKQASQGTSAAAKIEMNNRYTIEVVFQELLLYFMGFMIDENTGLFTNIVSENTFYSAFLLQRATEDYQRLYNEFVMKCYTLFSAHKLKDFHILNSYDAVPSIINLYVEIQLSKCRDYSQFGGAGDDIGSPQGSKPVNNLVKSIVRYLKETFTTEKPNTYNHFLNVQQDIIKQMLSKTTTPDYDAYLSKGVQHIMSSSCANIEYANNITDTSLYSELYNGYNSKVPKKIIDNAGKDKHPFKDYVFCPLSTMMDGLAVSSESVCKSIDHWVLPEAQNMNIKFNNGDNGVFIRRYSSKNYTVNTIHVQIINKGNTFETELAVNSENGENLVAREIFVQAITALGRVNLNTISSVEERLNKIAETAYKSLVMKFMSDFLQELNACIKYGSYDDFPYYDKRQRPIEPYNKDGDARRIFMTYDRPSLARMFWFYYNGNEKGIDNYSSRWDQHINTKSALVYPGPDTTGKWIDKDGYDNKTISNYFMYDYQSDIFSTYSENNFILGNIDSIELVKKIVMGNNNLMFQEFSFKHTVNEKDEYEALNFLDYTGEKETYQGTYLLPHPIVLSIINEKLYNGSMSITTIGGDFTNFNTISTIPQGSMFKFVMTPTTGVEKDLPSTVRLQVVFQNNGFVQQNTRNDRPLNIIGPSHLNIAVFNSQHYGNRRFGSIIRGSSIIYLQFPGGIENFENPRPMTGAGYQTGGMWQKGGFFMICS